MAGLLVLAGSSFRDRRFHLFVLLALVTWIPTTVAYVSERYMYLPSVAVAGAVAMALQRSRKHLPALVLGMMLVAAWTVHQGIRLQQHNQAITTSAFRSPATIDRIFRPLRNRIPPGSRLLMFDFPLAWLDAQFLEPILRDRFNDPALTVRILTLAPKTPMPWPDLDLKRIGKTRLEVRRSVPLFDQNEALFPWTDFRPGTEVSAPGLGFTARVIQGQSGRCSAVSFDFARNLDDHVVIRFEPSSGFGVSSTGLVVHGRVDIQPVPP